MSSNKKVLIDFNSHLPREIASLSKIFLALETIERLERKDIPNKSFIISKDDIAGYGTDVLSDLLSRQNQIRLDTLTLVGLMIKYSCNSSAAILANKILYPRSSLEKRAVDYWKLKNVSLVSKGGKLNNKFSLRHIFKMYQEIFKKRGKGWDFLREKMKTSRNIYYLFDQLNINVVASKSGTVFKNGYYWVSDTGIVEIKGQNYYLGAIVKRKRISTAVKSIRTIGRNIKTELLTKN
jgi:hypothetical protein